MARPVTITLRHHREAQHAVLSEIHVGGEGVQVFDGGLFDDEVLSKWSITDGDPSVGRERAGKDVDETKDTLHCCNNQHKPQKMSTVAEHGFCGGEQRMLTLVHHVVHLVLEVLCGGEAIHEVGLVHGQFAAAATDLIVELHSSQQLVDGSGFRSGAHV